MWLTNDPRIAAKLRKADADREKARDAARDLALEDKLAAYRAADRARRVAYYAAFLIEEEASHGMA